MSVTEAELKAHAEERKAPRVTLEQLEATICETVFLYHEQMTICILTLSNGFNVTGQSACADPKMYNKDIGDRIALEDAKNKIWPLLGYQLKGDLALIQAAAPPSKSNSQTYIGTKVVHASPINRRDYNAFRGWELPKDENGDDEGYLVEYADGGQANVEGYRGYVSWSPKDVFERAYRTL